ncbi:prostaglandin E2 receptor EP2 subtype [Eublepharis macularius]|uniref:Prostaglandin E2 receptor EP2 subtype n=1 Tax=Eublepharis macularius TaxID=481883 RepID=A0AA97KSF4_EUBMA|nr:prostaglandin E2 receptor EP2 subtype [Eublepharis macularius]
MGEAGGGCEARERLPPGESPAISAVMFAAGVLGNLTALALLLRARRRRRARRERLAPFHVLVLALVLTDLLGTCLTSPVVLAAYGRGRALVALAPGGRLCRYFAFAMSFFGLATVGSLGAMALERSLALGAPYLYRRLLSGRRAALPLAALPALYALAAAVCALPLLGFGRYVQYCPGTWCFIQTRFAGAPSADGGAAAFSLLYASLLLLLILAVLLCNLSAIRSLLRMHRRGQHARRPAAASLAPPPGQSLEGGRKPLSMAEELDHLILLAIMTIIFAVCSLPFTIRAFLNRFTGDGDYKEDLRALRFLSINSIIDPWVFAILRPPVLRLIRSVLHCRMPRKPRRSSRDIASIAKTEPSTQITVCRE